MNMLVALIQSKQLIPDSDLLPYADQPDATLFEDLKSRFHINETYLLSLISEAYQWPIKTPKDLIIDPSLLVTYESQLDELHIPIYQDNQGIGMLTHNPFEQMSILQKMTLSHTLGQVDFYLMEKESISQLLQQTHFQTQEFSPQDHFYTILNTAIEKKASDIHLFSCKTHGQISLRINGELRVHQSMSLSHWIPLISLIKYQAHLDISVYNKPQDGFIDIEDGPHKIHGRVSSIPSLYGEDIVIRLFENASKTRPLSELSFSNESKTRIKSILQQKQGVFLVTGPTGSGKTSTLYSCLQHIKSQNTLNIISLEDPIERAIPGVRQCPITEQNLSFSQGLRAALRQDPDVILIGEIRDATTAKIVFEAAYTGHLILSSLHTGNVYSSLLRLRSFDIDPFLINQALLGVLSQHLVSQSCPHCQQASIQDPLFKDNLGCSACVERGISGRILISELLCIDPKKHFDILNPQDSLQAQPYESFKEDILKKMSHGQISYSVGSTLLNTWTL